MRTSTSTSVLRSLRRVALASAALLSSGAFAAGSVKIVVTGVNSAEGKVRAVVCPEAQWLKACTFGGDAPAHPGSTAVTVANVPPGRYGVVAYHDRNNNGTADRNFLGIPTEDVGFSNDALKGLSKPKFPDAAFDHGAGDQTITLKLNTFSK